MVSKLRMKLGYSPRQGGFSQASLIRPFRSGHPVLSILRAITHIIQLNPTDQLSIHPLLTPCFVRCAEVVAWTVTIP